MGPYCKFCNTRCFVPVGNYDNFSNKEWEYAWIKAGHPILATCPRGEELDKEKLGFNWRDIKKPMGPACGV